jgi:hypothetical protein
MMGDEFKRVQYALFPKTIKYKRNKDGAKMTTNGITLQVTNTTGITIAEFWADMAEKWQSMTAKTGGTLFGKNIITFGKEGDIGDEVLTNIIQHQKNFLRPTNQRIVKTLNGIDCPIAILTFSAEDMDA